MLLVIVILFCLIVSRQVYGQPRIIGGITSQQGEWPFMAAIFFDNRLGIRCGGVIWNQDTILTAAHCLIFDTINKENDKIFAYLGHANISQADMTYLFGVREVIPHPEYDPSTLKYDIGVLRLKRTIDFEGDNKLASCVCDPEPLELLDTSKCVILGWGATRPGDEGSTTTLLREVVVPLFSSDHCTQHNELYNSHWNVCAGYEKGGKDTCVGDSGGPLLCPYMNKTSSGAMYPLVGVTSYGKSCGNASSPGYFTRVDKLLYWIAKNAGDI